MVLLALKLLLSPALVLIAWWLGRRFGPAIGGRAAALPIVAGPIMLVLALTQGIAFASQTAKYALLGITPLSAFGVAYSWIARNRLRSDASRFTQATAGLLLGWLVFLGVATGFDRACHRTTPSQLPLALCAVAAAFTLWLFPRLVAKAPDDLQPLRAHDVRKEIGGRILGAMLLVGTLTTVAARLGPAWSGLLASFPVAFSVVLVASHLCDGADTVRPVVCGYLAGLWGYLVFLVLFSWLLPSLGLAATLLISWPAAPLVQWGHHRWRRGTAGQK